MATNGSVTSTNGYHDEYGYRRLTFSWSATQSVENNTSTISWSFTTDGGFPWYIVYSKTKLVIDGQTVYNVPGSQNIPPSGQRVPWTIATGTITLTHNSVGERSFSVSAQAGIYEHDVNCTLSATWTLDAIPRASSVAASGDVFFGQQGTLQITRASSDFTDGVHWAFGSQIGSIVADEEPTAALSINWTPPASLMEEIPNATSGVVQIITHTFKDGVMIAQRTSNITVKVPDSVVPAVTVGLTNTDTTFGGYTQNLSKVGVAISASGVYRSTIASYKTVFEGTNYAGANITTNVIKSSGALPLSITVTDSRGRSTTLSQTVNAMAYSNPAVEFSVHRCLADGTADEMGAYAKVWIHATGSAIGSNDVTPVLKMRQAGQSPPAAWTDVDLTGAIVVTTDTDKEVNKIVAANDAYSWDFLASASDLATSSSALTINISVGYATLDFFKGGKGIAFGTTASGVGFKCAMDAEFTGDVILSGLRIRAGSKLVSASAAQENTLFSYAELDALFGTNDSFNENVVVLASNGDISADTQGGNKIIDGTFNDSSGVKIHTTVALSGVTIRVNYIAIHF